MSMGYGANYADVIEDTTIQEICPEKYKAFLDALKQANMDVEALAVDLRNQSNEAPQFVYEQYDALIADFNRATKMAGLVLSYHNQEDNGDLYDDVDGAFWVCTNLYQLSSAGKCLNGKFERKLFVTFG